MTLWPSKVIFSRDRVKSTESNGLKNLWRRDPPLIWLILVKYLGHVKLSKLYDLKGRSVSHKLASFRLDPHLLTIPDINRTLNRTLKTYQLLTKVSTKWWKMRKSSQVIFIRSDYWILRSAFDLILLFICWVDELKMIRNSTFSTSIKASSPDKKPRSSKQDEPSVDNFRITRCYHELDATKMI